MGGKEKRTQIASRLPRHQKRDPVSFPTADEKKPREEEEAKSAKDGDGGIAGHSAKK